jgi:hypothetical protein
MQLEDIKTVEQAKALAFDCIQRIEVEQNNLRVLQARIQELNETTKSIEDTLPVEAEVVADNS